MKMSSESRFPSKTETDIATPSDDSRKSNETLTPRVESNPPDLRNAISEALVRREQRLFKEVRKARSNPTERTIHDLRVAMRRMIALLEVVNTILPGSGADGFRKRLKKHLSFLSSLRDTQVQILETEEMIQTYDILRDFLFDLKAREAVQTKRACKEVDRIELGTMKDYFEQLKPRLDEFLSPPAVREAAQATLQGRLANIYMQSVPLRNEIRNDERSRAEKIHQLRLLFKRFRYTTEIMQPVRPLVSTRLLNRMSKYQGKMGVVQDTRVLTTSIVVHENRMRKKERKRGLPPDDSFTPVKTLLADRLKEQVELFVSAVDEFDKYWECIK